jgi:putative peptidoglycan lipid II flippase
VQAALGITVYLVLPPGHVVLGLAGAFAVTYTLGAAVAWLLASRRMHGLGGRAVAVALTRMYLAALPAAVLAFGVVWGTTRVAGLTPLSSAVMLVLGGGPSLALYLAVAHRMRIPEVNSVVGMVARRVGR